MNQVVYPMVEPNCLTPIGLYYPANRFIHMLEFRDLNQFVQWFDETIKFNSKYDKCYINDILQQIAVLDFINVSVNDFHDSTVYELMFVYKNHLNVGNFFMTYVTVYDDGLAYVTDGRIYIPDSQNNLRYYQPRINEVNFNYTICFKFVKMFYDVQIPNREFLIDLMRIVTQHITNYLTSLGFACQISMFDGLTEIRIETQTENHVQLLHKFLLSVNWSECLQSLNGIISAVRLMSENYLVKRIKLSSGIKNDLVIRIENEYKQLLIKLTLTNPMITYLYNEHSDTEEYNGWEFAPQLKYVYTNPKWNVEPIYEFKVYGLKQVFSVHDKHIPLMQLNLLRVDGFKINDSHFWFDNPQYVEIPFQTLNPSLWNKFVLNQLIGD